MIADPLCCDGSANKSRKDNTNVVRLFLVLCRKLRAVDRLLPPRARYDGGPRRAGIPGPLVSKQLERISGYGLEADLRDLSAFLMRHHRSGDRMFLFGFSRSAHTARGLVEALLRALKILRIMN